MKEASQYILFSEKFSEKPSSEVCKLYQNVDVQYKTKDLTHFTFCPQGELMALGGKRGLFLVNLSNPSELQPKFKHRPIRSDFNALEWSQDPTILAEGNNQLVHLWQYSEGHFDLVTEPLKAHRRKISDLSWSFLDFRFMATCSSDQFIYVWDLRDLTKPAMKKMRTIGAPPSRLKWNRIDAVLLASTHHGQVNVWDLRKTNLPLLSIYAETGEINCIDWSYNDKDILLTSCRSNKVKLWSVGENSSSIGAISTAGVVEGAQFTPFGKTVAVNLRNSDLVNLFNIENPQVPLEVDTLGGNMGSSVTFGFHTFEISGIRQHQLAIFAAQEGHLQLLCLEPSHLQACGQPVGDEEKSQFLLYSGRTLSNRKPAVTSLPKLGMTMEDEFDSLETNPVPGAILEKLDKQDRALFALFQRRECERPVLKLKMTFPAVYPHDAPPAFTILENRTGIPDDKLKEEVVNLGDEYVYGKNENCIRPCLKLITTKYTLDPILSQLISGLLSAELPKPSPLRSPSQSKCTSEQILAKLGPDYESYIVASGDTLAKLALTFNMEKSALRKINSIQQSSQLLPGRIIVVKKNVRKERTGSVCLKDKIALGEVAGGMVLGKSDGFKKTSFTLECPKNYVLLKDNLTYVKIGPNGEFDYIHGVMTVTPRELIFEPNADDEHVKLRGVMEFTIIIEIPKIVECNSIKPMDERVNGETEAYLWICCLEKQRFVNLEIIHFMAKTKRTQEICSLIEGFISKKRERKLLETLNLDTPLEKGTGKIEKGNTPSFTKLGTPLQIISSRIVGTQSVQATTPSESSDESDEESLIIGKSELIEKNHFKMIRHNIPVRYRHCDMKLLFSTSIDGTSLQTLYVKTAEFSPTLVVIEDNTGHRFGGYASEEWANRGHSFFGSGESFVFSLKPDFKCYKWTHANDYFMIATKDFIGMGGGTSAHFAFYIDSELNWGTSEVSNTFLNRRLSGTEEFSCAVLEVWGFTGGL